MQPFDIDVAMTRIADAVAPYPKAAMFELAEQGYDTAFEQLIACLLSVRTRDEVSVRAAPRLFAVARTPDEVAGLSEAEILGQIRDVTFAERKAGQIREIARRVRDEFNGDLPCDAGILQSFDGIGPKCANLTLGVACGVPVISVDIHVHRVTNRWGYVRATTPEKTMVALEHVLPERYRIEINRLLVPFGKHICTGERPKCSTCPVRSMCARVGVTSHR
ncbi:MAG TPA: endonuclease III [Thermomicrobiales bacterium]|nr:endonuclease III [Thermomicrobiales bacterium]